MPDPPLPSGYTFSGEPALPKGYSVKSKPATNPNLPQMSAATPADREAMRHPKLKSDTEGMTTEHKLEYEATRASTHAGEALPMVGATIGAATGGPIGAGVGAAAGQAISDKVETGVVKPVKAAVQGVENAALEYVGGKILPKALGAMGKALSKTRGAEIVNDYIGLAKNQLPKFNRTVQSAQEIGRTVLDKVGIKPNLSAQRTAIESTREAYDQATRKIVATPGGRLADVHSVLYNRAVKLLDEAEKEGVPKEQLNAIDKNLEGMLGAAKQGGMMTPAEMHEMRHDIQKQITDWSSDTVNIRQRFLQGVYHDLNDAIERTLPTDAAKAFRDANKVQSNLITARSAVDNKLLKESLHQGPGKVTKAARLAGRAVVGGAAGGVLGGEAGHGKLGAAAGAAFNMAGGVDGISFPRADIISEGAQAGLSKALTKMARVSKKTPQVVRAMQAIEAVQSRPQQ